MVVCSSSKRMTECGCTKPPSVPPTLLNDTELGASNYFRGYDQFPRARRPTYTGSNKLAGQEPRVFSHTFRVAFKNAVSQVARTFLVNTTHSGFHVFSGRSRQAIQPCALGT